MARCKSTFTPWVWLKGKPVRCEQAEGHEGDHGNSFAARYWRNEGKGYEGEENEKRLEAGDR